MTTKALNYSEDRLKNTLFDIAGLLGLKISGDSLITHYAADSRQIVQGGVFFALKGERSDGHAFLEEAAKKGAIAAVVSEGFQGEDFGLKLLKVACPLGSLQCLARETLRKSQAKVIAVTGSVGKTTTKEFLKTILQERFHLLANVGSQNTQISLPLTILNNLEQGHELVILEMGMTESGNISRLVDIAPPYLALITNVELVHACNFNTLEEIALAKAEILRHPDTEVAVLPRGCNYYGILQRTGTCRKIAYAMDSPIGERLQMEERLFFLQKHFLHNVNAAATAAMELGMSLEEIEKRFPYLELPKQRFEIVMKGGITFVNDSYNASALSIKAAMDALPLPKNGRRRIAVLGEMLELGNFSKGCHEEVGEHAIGKVDALYLLGEGCRPIVEQWDKVNKPVSIHTAHEDLIESLRRAIQPGDVVLVKGSRAKEMWKVIDEI